MEESVLLVIFITPEDTFVVEVEEEITEDTVFDRLFEVYEISEGEYNPTSNRKY
ncbi:putative phage PVL protein [Staphylococcus aureus]|nr:putative phage PVL protein [Staphylococcus aureus]